MTSRHRKLELWAPQYFFFEGFFKFPRKTFSILFYFLFFKSYLMYNLSEWHRGTPTVPPVGAVNVPAENPKIQKIHIFEDFWGHFFLINHIGFSLKYVISKSSTDFFHRKNNFFWKIFIFYYFIISHTQPMQVASRNSI